MKIWTDNTSIHSAARCVEGFAKGEADISGLLQLATQVIFCENIYVSGFEGDHIAIRTREFCSFLKNIGLNNNEISIVDIPENIFKRVCQKAAEKFSAELEYTLPENSQADFSLLDSSAPDFFSLDKYSDDTIHDLIISDNYLVHFEEYKRNAFSETKQGSAAYMVASCNELLSQFRTLATSPSWSETDTSLFLIYLRTALNSEIAEDLKSIEYSPAPARARLTEIQSEYILGRINEKIKDLAKELEPSIINVPTVAEIICEKGKHEPKAILEEAINLRYKATELRNYLIELVHKRKVGDSDDLHHIRQGIDELSLRLEQSIIKNKKPLLRDTFKFNFVGLVPLPDFHNFYEWVQFKISQKRITILSEFAKDAANRRLGKHGYERLSKKAMKSKI
jgi:hypothetical protein